MKNNDFSGRLRQLINERGWGKLSLVALGRRLGCTGVCAHYYLTGQRVPSMARAVEIAALFGVCVEWLITGRGPVRPGESLVS